MVHWLVERVAVVINRHQMGHGGEAPYKRVNQRDALASQFEFGGQVLARFAFTRAQAKMNVFLAPRSTYGTWVGIREAIVEHIVIFQSGEAVRVRTVFRRPEEERWNLERIMKTQAIPSNLTPGSQ